MLRVKLMQSKIKSLSLEKVSVFLYFQYDNCYRLVAYSSIFLIAEFEELKLSFTSLEKIVKQLDQKLSVSPSKPTDSSSKPSSQPAKKKDDDDVDLFGSDSEVCERFVYF